jgi:hypothetical protein
MPVVDLPDAWVLKEAGAEWRHFPARGLVAALIRATKTPHGSRESCSRA